MRNILDFHTHAYPEKVARKAVAFLNDYYHIHCQGNGTLGDLLGSAHEGGVTHLLVHSVATKPDQVENVNSWLGAHIGGHVYGFGSIHPDYPDIPKELARIRSLGLRGVKLHPDFQHFYADDPAMDAVYGAADMPVLLHAGDCNTDFSSPRRIAHILDRFPNLTVIAAHLGGYSEWNEAAKWLMGKGYPNLYVDTSSSIFCIGPERARDMVRGYGAEHVLFGTDYPLTRHKEELERFFSMGLSDEENRLILFENAKRLLRLDS